MDLRLLENHIKLFKDRYMEKDSGNVLLVSSIEHMLEINED